MRGAVRRPGRLCPRAPRPAPRKALERPGPARKAAEAQGLSDIPSVAALSRGPGAVRYAARRRALSRAGRRQASGAVLRAQVRPALWGRCPAAQAAQALLGGLGARFACGCATPPCALALSRALPSLRRPWSLKGPLPAGRASRRDQEGPGPPPAEGPRGCLRLSGEGLPEAPTAAKGSLKGLPRSFAECFRKASGHRPSERREHRNVWISAAEGCIVTSSRRGSDPIPSAPLAFRL